MLLKVSKASATVVVNRAVVETFTRAQPLITIKELEVGDTFKADIVKVRLSPPARRCDERSGSAHVKIFLPCCYVTFSAGRLVVNIMLAHNSGIPNFLTQRSIQSGWRWQRYCR